jgi:hypothetical protein
MDYGGDGAGGGAALMSHVVGGGKRRGCGSRQPAGKPSVCAMRGSRGGPWWCRQSKIGGYLSKTAS